MPRHLFLLLTFTLAALLATCKQGPVTGVKVLIGPTVVPQAGARPIEDAIIIIAQDKITAVGERKDIPVPQASDRTDLSGQWVIPATGYFITVGDKANMIILKNAPNGIKPAAEADIAGRIVAGEWEIH